MRSENRSRTDRAQYRRFLSYSVPAIVLALAPAIALTLVGNEHLGVLLSTILALLSVLGGICFAVALWRQAHAADEYQRLRLLRSLGISFGVTVVTCFALGIAGLAGYVVIIPEWIIFTSAMTSWVITQIISAHHDQ